MVKLRLIVFVIILLLCGKAISQKDTPKNVVISLAIADSIGKDLVKGDICKTELKLTKDNLRLTNEKLKDKDSIINSGKKEIKNLNAIIVDKDGQFSAQEIISKTYKEDLVREEKKTIFYKVLSFLGVLATCVTLLTK